MDASFVHLKCHTEFSLVDGIVRVKPLMGAVREAWMPAVALTDQSNLFAMVKFYRAALATGVKPIIGVDAYLQNDKDLNAPHRVTLLCKHTEGYRRLAELVSRSYTEGQRHGRAVMQYDWLTQEMTSGLIALSGGREGDVGRALLNSDPSQVSQLLTFWQDRFPDSFYLELQRTGRPNEEDYNALAVSLALENDLPVVATNDVMFLQQDDFEVHEARVCIHDGRTLDDPRRPRRYTDQQYLRSPQEMAELFADLPEALANTVEIAKRCNVELTLGENFLPNFPVPEGMTVDDFLRAESHKGLEARLEILLDKADPKYAEKRKEYIARLDWELDTIIQMGFPGYFLIVADFIRWAKEHGIPVGPGRGSGAGSLVAYALTITDLDPLEYDLLFERFLNPERVSMPDFDIDFCMENRDRVIEYVSQHYGRDRVSQIITYGTMAAKAVVRDVGRVLGHPYGFVDKIAKLIPFEIGITLEKALDQEEALRQRYTDEEEVQTMIDLARSLEGITRNAGKHAGGVVIGPTALTDFSPLYCEENGDSLVTQFDKDDVEAVGLVKFDFLGLRTLTIIDWAVKNIIKSRGEQVDITRIPLDDAHTFKLLQACQTTAVFQLESRGMKELIGRLQPDSFEDIIALVALFRPGPLQSGMVDDFINRKHGRARVEYPHPDLEPILKPTYGVILYQEQVMQIAQVLAGYTLGAADMLRPAMGKKKPEEMAKQREIFTQGALARGIDEKLATYIFDLMEKFAGYGFNKSHSAAYALVSYQTAWLKAHYPAEFMAAVLSADLDNTDKVVGLIEECRTMGLPVVPPDVNSCDYPFTVENQNIYYGLGAIKGVGESAILAIKDERLLNGVYPQLFDFCKRVDLKKLNRRALETLIKSGAMDKLGPNRATLMSTLSSALQTAEQHKEALSTGQNDLFGFSDEQATEQAVVWNEQDEWQEQRRLELEKESLGLYLSGHPLDRWQSEIDQFVTHKLAKLPTEKYQNAVLAGLILGVRTRKTKRGDTMAILTVDDKTARQEFTLFSDAYSKYAEQVQVDKIFVFVADVGIDDFSGGMRVNVKEVFDIPAARNLYAKRLIIRANEKLAGNGFVHSLQGILKEHQEGSCPVIIDYQNSTGRGSLRLPAQWSVSPNESALTQIKRLVGAENVDLQYR
ncbi:MAG: DNA polymerase III subunit alpha [Gammaproteobacteria bacterium]|nr:DNA polymerase III subunit alpha [Gammaproteobacteria bacterium]